jgi:hypothetical protein
LAGGSGRKKQQEEKAGRESRKRRIGREGRTRIGMTLLSIGDEIREGTSRLHSRFRHAETGASAAGSGDVNKSS